MKYFWKKYKTCLVLSIYLFSMGAIFFFAGRPMILKIEEKNNKIQEKITDQENKKEKLSNLPAIRKQFEMINDQEDKTGLSLAGENVVDLVEKVEKISEETDNKIEIELFEDKEDAKSADKQKKTAKKEEKRLTESLPGENYIRMKISLIGEYDGFINFLRKLENMEYYSDVVSFKLSVAKEDIFSKTDNPFEDDISGESRIVVEEGKMISSEIEAFFYTEKK